MTPTPGDKSDLLFKRLLIIWLLVYFIITVVIELIPYTPKVIIRSVKPQRVVKLLQLPVKEPPISEKQKRLEEEKKRLAEEERRRQEQKKIEEEKKRLAEERRLKEEQKKMEAERRKIEEEKRREEEKRLAEEKKKLDEEKQKLREQERKEEEKRLAEEKKRLEEEKKIAEEQKRIEDQKRLEEERKIAEEKRRVEEEKRAAEEQRRIQEQKRVEEERKIAEEKQRIEEEKRVAEEQRRIQEQKRVEEERKIAEEKQRIEEEKRIAEEQRRIQEQKRVEEERRIAEEKRLAKERDRQIAMSSGLLKTMKDGKKSVDAIVNKEEIQEIVSTPSDRLIQAQQKILPAPASIRDEMKELKGSKGIGDIPQTLAKTQMSGLSGNKELIRIDITYSDNSKTSGEGSLAMHKGRSQESIKDVVTKHRGSLDFIYKKALRNTPTLKGVMIVEFIIAENGDVTSARIVSTTLKDPSFEDQVIKRIQSWKFTPAPNTGDTIVSYPIEFSPL